MKFELPDDDVDILLIGMGFAVGALMAYNKKLAYRFVRVLNKMFAGRDSFEPYAIPPEYQEK